MAGGMSDRCHRQPEDYRTSPYPLPLRRVCGQKLIVLPCSEGNAGARLSEKNSFQLSVGGVGGFTLN